MSNNSYHGFQVSSIKNENCCIDGGKHALNLNINNFTLSLCNTNLNRTNDNNNGNSNNNTNIFGAQLVQVNDNGGNFKTSYHWNKKTMMMLCCHKLHC